MFSQSGHLIPYGTLGATRPSSIEILEQGNIFMDHRETGVKKLDVGFL
jgi:hypothetical protein